MRIRFAIFLAAGFQAVSSLHIHAASPSVQRTAANTSETAVMRVLDEYLGAFLSGGDAESRAANVNYPFVSYGGGRNYISNTREELIEGYKMMPNRVTEWASRRIIQNSNTRYHVAAEYSLYDAAHRKAASVQGVYLVTHENGHWGVKLIFGEFVAPGQPIDTSAAETAALKVADDYMSAFNKRDPAAFAATLNYPHTRVSDTEVKQWPTAEDFAKSTDFQSFAQRAGSWDHSAWDEKKVLMATPDMAIVQLQFSRYRADNSKISTFPTLYLITKQGDHWGVRARSSFAP